MSTNPSPSVPRSEYPRPQWVRSQWLCLNGPWEFEIDQGESGLARGLLERPLAGRIIVPFCPESQLSGIGNPDFLNAVWYRREVAIPMFLATKLYDPTRPVLDISGYCHRLPEADIYDCHDYTQDPAEFARRYSGVAGESLLANTNPSISSPDEPRLEQLGLPVYRNQSAIIGSIPYRGQPYFVSEFGGSKWSPEVKEGEASWGYGQAPQALEEFYQRFEGLCRVLLEAPYMFGYCYTQLTDVFQEQNGLFFFDRRSKFDVERLRSIQQRPAAIE